MHTDVPLLLAASVAANLYGSGFDEPLACGTLMMREPLRRTESIMPAEVTLEPIARRHAEDVQRLASHPDIVATTKLPEPYPDDGARAWIECLLPRQRAGKEYAFAILNEDGILVGVTGLVDVSKDEAGLGYWIGKPYWNRGYATAANRHVLDFAFGQLDVRCVFARPLERNRPSRRVLEKLSFAFERLEKSEHPKWNETDKIARYELERGNWIDTSA